MPKKGGKRGGSPSKYKPEYCERLVEFFSGPRTERIVKSVTTGKNDYEKTEYETVPCELPFFSAFARNIGVSWTVFSVRWPEKYPDFAQAYVTAKELQKEFLVQNGLAGHYPPASFIFTAKNITDMRDEQIIKNPADEPKAQMEKVRIEKMTAEELDIALNGKILEKAVKKKKL